MASKTRLTELVKAFDAPGVESALVESPELLGWRDERGRNWLHLCCSVDIKGDPARAQASIRTADVLLRLGLDKDSAAFTEGEWKATPVWYAVGRGKNRDLIEHLLKLGCNPNFCLFACVWNRDLDAIRLFIRHGADVEDRADGGTPFLGAVEWSRFEEAEELLKHGAKVDAKNAKGMTALHLMLKKDSDKRWFEMLMRYGPRGDIPGPDGKTAIDIMRRKRDPDFRRLAEQMEGAFAAAT
jgi:hypothetical protein